MTTHCLQQVLAAAAAPSALPGLLDLKSVQFGVQDIGDLFRIDVAQAISGDLGDPAREALKREAARRTLPYQTLIRVWLKERLDAEARGGKRGCWTATRSAAQE